MNEYQQGNIVVSEVVFRSVAGIAVDPSTVNFAYEVGTSVSAPITYDDATEPVVGVIARLGVGRYVTWIDTTDILGVVTENWTSGGQFQAAGRRQFKVIP